MITITIKTDNAAFQDGNRKQEVARILATLSDLFRDFRIPNGHYVRDVNGNIVGAVKMTGTDRDGEAS